MTEDMLSWLRREVEAEKAVAEAAEAVSPGPWVNTGQDGQGSEGDAWQIHGAPTEESGVEWSDEARDVVPAPSPVATAQHEDGGGVWTREAADHIVLQQPRDTIARCEFELAEIARHVENFASDCEVCGEHEAGFPCDYLRRHAYAYRHRPGYLPEWAPEGTTP